MTACQHTHVPHTEVGPRNAQHNTTACADPRGSTPLYGSRQLAYLAACAGRAAHLHASHGVGAAAVERPQLLPAVAAAGVAHSAACAGAGGAAAAGGTLGGARAPGRVHAAAACTGLLCCPAAATGALQVGGLLCRQGETQHSKHKNTLCVSTGSKASNMQVPLLHRYKDSTSCSALATRALPCATGQHRLTIALWPLELCCNEQVPELLVLCCC